jgi:hypothetical protein
VDAERGLALRRLPRVLALQLKRFRYDFRLGQRFKINDRFRFPTTIDMAEYVRPLPGMTPPAEAEPSAARHATATCQAAHAAHGSVDSVDAMEMDSEVPAPIGACVAGTGACGAPIGTCGATAGACVADTAELCEQPDASRVPLPYELYGVLVHSGSASFGHYFALIKDLDEGGGGKGEWHEFNDQLVRPIKESDLAKAYGGGGPRGGTSSAYMLLYRAVDADADRGAATLGAGDIASPSQARWEVPRGAASGGALRVGFPGARAEMSCHEPKRLCLAAPVSTESARSEPSAAAPDPEADASENPYSYMGF